jgi:hypothetical protein
VISLGADGEDWYANVLDGGGDQDRLGKDRFGRWRVLDQLDEMSAVHYSTGRDRDILSNGKVLRTNGRPAGHEWRGVLGPIPEPLDEVGAARGERPADHFRERQIKW